MLIESKHLKEVNETYKEHMFNALWISWKLFLAGGACFIHAFVPDWFIHTASNECKNIINLVNDRVLNE